MVTFSGIVQLAEQLNPCRQALFALPVFPLLHLIFVLGDRLMVGQRTLTPSI